LNGKIAHDARRNCKHDFAAHIAAIIVAKDSAHNRQVAQARDLGRGVTVLVRDQPTQDLCFTIFQAQVGGGVTGADLVRPSALRVCEFSRNIADFERNLDPNFTVRINLGCSRTGIGSTTRA
jgi:hypothetical protein